MRRTLRGAAILLLLAVVGTALWVRVFGGGPVLDPFPGGALRGEPAGAPPPDWRFAAEEAYLDVESRASWLPYSARVWFMVHEGRLHVILPSFFGDGLARRLERDPRLRVRVAGRLYEQVAARVDDPALIGAMLAPFARRQFAIEIEGAVTPVPGRSAVETWVYRLDDPAADAASRARPELR